MNNLRKFGAKISILAATSLLLSSTGHAATCGGSGTIKYLYDVAQLSGPLRMVTTSSGIYVADFLANSVYVYNLKGNLQKEISVGTPRCVAVSQNGDIYVGNRNSVVVVTEGENGILTTNSLISYKFGSTADIAIASDGRIFVVDGLYNRVYVHAADGSSITDFGYGTLSAPNAIALDETNGRIYIADQKNYMIRTYSLSDYSLLSSFGSVQTDGNDIVGKFNFITGIGVDSTTGTFYVTDSGPDKVHVYDKNYAFLGTIGGYSEEAGGLNKPVDVAVDKYGRILVISLEGGRISAFRSEEIINPVPYSPANNSSVLSLTPRLSVVNGCINSLPLTYEFQVAADDRFEDVKSTSDSVKEGSSITSWLSGGLIDHASYYWRARGTDDVSLTDWTQTYLFKTNSLKFSDRGEESVSEGLSGTDANPVIATDEKNGIIWLAWQGDTENEGIFSVYIRSFDAVKDQWQGLSRISSGAVNSSNPSLAVDPDGRVFLAWEENGSITATYYDPSLKTWAGQSIISQGVMNAANSALVVNKTTGELVALWDGEISGEKAVFMSRFNRTLGEWDLHERVTSSSEIPSNPSGAFDNEGRLWISWTRTGVDGNKDVISKNLDPTTKVWSEQLIVAGSSAYNENFVKTAVDANNTVWFVYLSEGKVAARSYNNSSKALGDEHTVNDGITNANAVSVFDNSGKLWVVWDRESEGGRDIFTRMLSDSLWSDEAALTSHSMTDADPAVSIYMNQIWLAWETDRNGNQDIYAKSFYIDDAPSAPVLLSPVNGEVLKTGNPALTVSAALDPDTSLLFYEFDIDTVNTFDSANIKRSGRITGDESGAVWHPGTLGDNASYYWRVRAFDGEAYGPWSATGDFKVMTQNFSPIIDSYSPNASNHSMTGGGTADFAVTASDPNGDPLFYTWAVDGEIVADGAAYKFAPSAGKSGYSVNVSVSDGELSVTVGWTVSIISGSMVTVTTEPSGANVYIDGNYGYLGRLVGTTPLSLTGMTLGTHSLIITASGYEPVYKQIVVADGQDISIAEQMMKAGRMNIAGPSSQLKQADGSAIKTSGRATPFAADWNNDGFKDLLVGDSYGQTLLYISEEKNDGSRGLAAKGVLSASDGSPVSVPYNAAPFVADWNNDGKKDLLIGSGDGYINLYLNRGTEEAPIFTSSTRIMAGGVEIKLSANAYPLVIDFDNDGRKDLLAGGGDGVVVLYMNSGADHSPEFTTGVGVTADGLQIALSGDAKPFAADWNSDGKKDLVVGDTGSGRLFFNTGTDTTPSFLSVSALGDWLKQARRDRRNRDYVSYIGYSKDLPALLGQIKGGALFVVNWNDNGGKDILVGTEEGDVLLFNSAD